MAQDTSHGSRSGGVRATTPWSGRLQGPGVFLSTVSMDAVLVHFPPSRMKCISPPVFNMVISKVQCAALEYDMKPYFESVCQGRIRHGDDEQIAVSSMTVTPPHAPPTEFLLPRIMSPTAVCARAQLLQCMPAFLQRPVPIVLILPYGAS